MGGSFHSKMLVHQRVRRWDHVQTCEQTYEKSRKMEQQKSLKQDFQ